MTAPMAHFFAPANSSSKSTISLICTRNQRSIFVRLKISSMVKPARRAWRMKKMRSALGTLSSGSGEAGGELLDFNLEAADVFQRSFSQDSELLRLRSEEH